MDRLLYVSASGLAHVDRAQALHANNLANVSTTGFKADLARVSTGELGGDSYRTRAYAQTLGGGVDLSSGARIDTGRNLDVAVDGDHYLSVRLPDGREGYTRDGSLQVDALGRLLTSQGLEVLGQTGPVALPPYDQLVIGVDGSITVLPQGQTGDALAQIDRIKLVAQPPEGFAKDATGLLVTGDDEPLPIDEEATLTSGVLEASNVNAIGELSEIISLSRQFEIHIRLVRNAEENAQASSQLLRLGR